MNTEINTALAAIEAQQQKHKQGSAPWCVGEQLKDMLRAEPALAPLVEQDLAQPGMDLARCELKIRDFAGKHKDGNVGFCGPADAERIIREFYGLPPRGEAPAQESAKRARKVIRLTDFL